MQALSCQYQLCHTFDKFTLFAVFVKLLPSMILFVCSREFFFVILQRSEGIKVLCVISICDDCVV